MRFLALLTCLSTVLSVNAEPIRPTRYRMVFPRAVQGSYLDLDAAREWHAWLDGFDYDIAGFCASESEVELILRDSNALAPLLDAGFTIVEHEVSRPLADRQLDGELRGVPAGYATYADVQTFLSTTEADHPTITQVFIAGQTTELRDVIVIEISDHPGQPEDEPAILLNGLHHSREVATPHVIMDAITYLTDGYAAGDPQAVDWVTNYKIFCVPMVNPDGSHEVFEVDDFHRKNKRGVCTPTNPGVDLNRNYPYHWGTGVTACERSPTGGSSSTSCADTFRGPTAASEPETAAMMDLAEQQRFVMAVSYHSSGRFIDYPYACNDGTPDSRMPEHDMIHEMMIGMRDGIAAVDGVNYTVYSPIALSAVNGDDTSWYYAHHGTYAMIVEMGTSFAPTFATSVAEVARNRGGWQFLCDRLGGARLDVRVLDLLTGLPMIARVELLDFTFDTDELPRMTDATFGRKRFLVPGTDTYSVRVSAAGYQSVMLDVAVGEEPSDVTVMLLASGEVLGDSDDDGDVDLADFAAMQRCTGASPISVPCRRFDFTGAELITAAQVPGFAAAMVGPQ